MNKYLYFNREYVSFKEFVQEHCDEDIDALGAGICSNSAVFKEIVEDTLGITIASTDILASSAVNTLFVQYMYPRLQELLIGYYENDDEITDMHKSFMNKICTIIRHSYQRYKPMIDYYTELSDELTNDLHSYSTNKFNDTPQNTGSFEDETYTSTWTKNDVYSPVGSNAAKLNECAAVLQDWYSRWVDVFMGVFIYD